jgi:nitroreductase
MNETQPLSFEERWRARYREAHTGATVTCDATLDTLLSHRSVRSFLPQAVSEAALEAAIAAAQSASSSSNLQLWSVIAVTDPERKARLAILAGQQQHVAQAPLLLAWVLDLSRIGRLGQQRDQATSGLDYLESFVVGSVDTALAAQNAAVAFESFGLGMVYIGAMRNHPEAVARELGLPPSCLVLFGMCVGFADPHDLPAIKPRLPQAVVLHRERYEARGEADLIAHYDQQVLDYQRERGSPAASNWSDAVLNRVHGPESLMGRERLHQALNELGFKLL